MAGCQRTLSPQPTVRDIPSSGPAFAAAGDASATGSVFDRPAQRLVVAFKVDRITAPMGTFTAADSRIWTLVTGRLSSAALSLHLADNGFRAAIGQETDRKLLVDYLNGLSDLRHAPDEATPDAARPVEMELGTCPPRITAFYYDERGKLHGRDFENATAKWLMSFEMRSTNLQEVWLRVTPSLEEPPGPKKWVVTSEGAREEPEERKQVFEDLTVLARVPPEGFLLLGATSAVYDHQSLVSRAFFIERKEKNDMSGEEETRESVYVISPIVRRYGQGSR